MKKSILIVLVLLLLLTGCRTAPAEEDKTLSSTPSSGSVTPPSSSAVPPTSSVPSTSTPATNPPTPTEIGHVLIFNGPGNQYSPDWWPKEGLIDHLYWVSETTKERVLICDEPVIAYAFNDTHVFFNTESEPTKVYATAIGDFTKCELIYESAYGDVSDMHIESDLQGFLQFVAEEKKFVVLDIATSESTLLMEQDYIEYAWLFGTGDGITWSEIIEFDGIATGNVHSDTGFTYNYVTGKLGYGDS